MRTSLVASAVLVALTALAPAAAAAPEYTIAALPTPPGQPSGIPLSVNAFGVAVGTTTAGFGPGNAVVWRGGAVIDLGPGVAVDVNAFGTVVGHADGVATLWRGGRAVPLTTSRPSTGVSVNTWGDAVVLSGSPEKFSLWRAGTLTELPAPGTHRTGGIVNDLGQIALNSTEGVYRCTRTACAALPLPPEPVNLHAMNGRGQVLGTAVSLNQRAVLWTGSAMTDLGHLGGATTDIGGPDSLNDLGVVVGWSKAADGRFHAFSWRDGVMTDLGDPGVESRAYAVNGLGHVVGHTSGTGGVIAQAALWRDGKTVALPQLGGAPWCVARQITDLGRVTGFCVDAAWRSVPVVWSVR
ncbi:hypothetical protein ACFQV2_33775 [Actinokineospora soli]|uniref:Extracellular repeat, HAF family n=1 Tax=Actinokineospora soli TaxID=1048753 RepID=A0ABW2TXT5_9PSEU